MAAGVLHNPQWIIRITQSIARRAISNFDEANAVGREIGNYIITHWEQVASVYDGDCVDEYDVVERIAKAMVNRHAELAAQAAMRMPHI